MTCKFQKLCPVSSELCAKVHSPTNDGCYKAVMQAYKCVASDEPEQVALEAAQRVYRFHRPNENKSVAYLTVESWVNEGRIQ